MRYLERAEIIAVNKKLIQRSGEKFGIWNSHGLDAAIHRHLLYEKVPEVVAALMHSLMNNHCFEAANKRTALVAAQIILEDEGYQFSMDQNKLADRVEQMVKDHWNQVKITTWIKRRVKA